MGPGKKPAELATAVLLVEEDVILRLALGDFLRTCGYRVLEAANAGEAKAILNEQVPIAVLLMDAQLAGDGRGFELSKWAREKRRGLEIILTGGLVSKTEAAARLCESKSGSSFSAGDLKARIAVMRSPRKASASAKAKALQPKKLS